MKMLQKHYDYLTGGEGGYGYGAQAVDITSAAHWFISESGIRFVEIASEFPCIVPPWPVTWMEYKAPETFRFGNKCYTIPLYDQMHAYGILIKSHKIVDDEEEKLKILVDDVHLQWAEKSLNVRLSSEQMEGRRIELSEAIRDVNYPKWMVTYHLFRDFEEPLHICDFTFLADEYGALISGSGIWAIWYMPHETDVIGPKNHSENATGDAVQSAFYPSMFAVSLLHCKNVHLEDISVPAKVQAKREKRGIPTVTFKTLVVEPMRQQVRRETADDPSGEQNHIKRALHIARGHFKDYRDGPGLFGKYQGLYWWDMQVRGSAKAGTVIKDYKVKV